MLRSVMPSIRAAWAWTPPDRESASMTNARSSCAIFSSSDSVPGAVPLRAGHAGDEPDARGPDGRRQARQRHHLAVGDDGRPLDGVLELADVARPVVRHQRGHARPRTRA